MAFDARGHGGEDDTRLSFEAFCTAIDQWLHRIRIILIYHPYKRRVDPASCFDGVEAANNEAKLHVVRFILVLDLAAVRRDFDALDTLFYKCRGGFGFVLSHV